MPAAGPWAQTMTEHGLGNKSCEVLGRLRTDVSPQGVCGSSWEMGIRKEQRTFIEMSHTQAHRLTTRHSCS